MAGTRQAVWAAKSRPRKELEAGRGPANMKNGLTIVIGQGTAGPGKRPAARGGVSAGGSRGCGTIIARIR